MRIALVVPGGVDRSAEFRIIPALIALIERLAAAHEVLSLPIEPGVSRDDVETVCERLAELI